MTKLVLSALFLTSTMATLSAGPATLQGTYVEARTSEVFAGACVINGEAARAAVRRCSRGESTPGNLPVSHWMD